MGCDVCPEMGRAIWKWLIHGCRSLLASCVFSSTLARKRNKKTLLNEPNDVESCFKPHNRATERRNFACIAVASHTKGSSHVICGRLHPFRQKFEFESGPAWVQCRAHCSSTRCSTAQVCPNLTDRSVRSRACGLDSLDAT